MSEEGVHFLIVAGFPSDFAYFSKKLGTVGLALIASQMRSKLNDTIPRLTKAELSDSVRSDLLAQLTILGNPDRAVGLYRRQVAIYARAAATPVIRTIT